MSSARPFGRYRLLDRIGIGGMAEIFRATTEGPGGFEMEVCIKRILPHCSEDPEFVRMFIDEARVAARLRHANIVHIIDFNQVDDIYYIAMELVEGCDLRSLLKRLALTGERLGPARAAAIGAEICRGLGYAHGRRYQGQPMNIIHRDVSPHNVLLSYAGEVKVTDFGIAKAASRLSKTVTGLVKGKLAYMAPEQARSGEIDQSVDQFAMGLVLFEMLAGQRAYAGNSDVEVLQQAMRGAVPPLATLWPEVPPVLASTIARATALQPADRFPDMAALEQELRRFLVDISARPEDLDIGSLVRRMFGQGKPDRPRTELLPAVADLPPFDDEPASDGGSSVWRQTGGSDSSSITAAPATAQVALERVPTDPVAVLPATTVAGSSSLTLSQPVHAPSAAAARAPATAAALARPLLLWGCLAAALATGLLWWWPGAPVAESAGSTLDSGVLTPIAQVEPAAGEAPVGDPVATGATSIPDVPSNAGSIADAGTIVATARPPDRMAARAVRTGRVILLVTDSWAEVFLGARKLGETPLDVEVPAGRKRLRLYNADTKTEKWIAIEVKPGAVTQIATTLQPVERKSR